MDLSLDNLKVNADHKHLHLDPDILNSIDGVLKSYEQKKILNLDELDEEIKDLMSIQKEMDQKVAEIARKEESRRREEKLNQPSGIFRGIQGVAGYSGITGTQGIAGFYNPTGIQGHPGTHRRTEYIEETSDGFTVRCRVGRPRPRSGYTSYE